MTNEIPLIGGHLDSIRDEFNKLWLAMIVKRVLDDITEKIVKAPSEEFPVIIEPVQKRIKQLWHDIVRDEIDVTTAKEQFTEIIHESNSKLEGKYRIVDPEELMQRLDK